MICFVHDMLPGSIHFASQIFIAGPKASQIIIAGPKGQSDIYCGPARCLLLAQRASQIFIADPKGQQKIEDLEIKPQLKVKPCR